ncbi:MAG: glycosyltransferase family 9 protein [Ignavibacteriales bacterium]
MISPKKLLIVRTDRIGDVVLSLPMAELVKRKYPDCIVEYFVRKYTSSLLENNPFIDDVVIAIEENNKLHFNENLLLIKSKGFDTCIVVNPTFMISLMMFFARITNRIGTGYRWYSFLFNIKVFEHRKYAERHELEYNLNLLKKLGIDDGDLSTKINFNLYVKIENTETINRMLKEKRIDLNHKIVIVHPGSGGSSVDLPKEKLIELTKSLSSLENVSVIITGNKNEAVLCKEFEVNKSIINFAGELDLPMLKALINKADLFISNSTGPMHIAAALGVYVIGFFPNILSCSQKRWGPYTDKMTIFSPTIDCNNCTRQQCEKIDCMNSIDIGRVFDETKSVLKNLN